MHPESPNEGQNQGEASAKQAQDLVREAHSLCRGQSRVTQLQNAVAGSKRLFQAAIFRNKILIKINFSLL